MPTLGELIGLPKGRDVEGISLMELVDNKEAPQDERYLYSCLWRKRIGKLFHLQKDRTEQNNVIKKRKQYAQILSEKFNTFLKDCKKYQQKTIKYKLDKKEVEKLKALGYVQKNN